MSVKKFLKAAQEIKERAEEPKKEASHDESNWLVSYADMMTLLCGFFIMLFSMAKMDEPKYEKVKEALSKQFGGNYEAPTKSMAKFITDVVKQAGVESEAVVKNDGMSVTVTFQSTLFFETLSAEVKPEGKKVLEKLAKELYSRQKTEGKIYNVAVEGHTDSRPIIGGSFPSNWELSGSRASRVVRYFLDEHFAPDHLTSIGYADTRPEFTARKPDGTLDEELLAKNRRVVVRILSPDAEAIPLPKPPGAEAADKAKTTAQAAPGPAPSVGVNQVAVDKARLDRMKEERAKAARDAIARAQAELAKAQAAEAAAKSQAQQSLTQAQEAIARAKAAEAAARAMEADATAPEEIVNRAPATAAPKPTPAPTASSEPKLSPTPRASVATTSPSGTAANAKK